MTTVQAVYRNGVFEPTEQVDVPDGTPVRITVEEIAASPIEASRAVAIARRLTAAHPDLDLRAAYGNRAELNHRP